MSALSPYLHRPLRSELAYLAERYHVVFRFYFDAFGYGGGGWETNSLWARDRKEAEALARGWCKTLWKGGRWSFEGIAGDWDAVLFSDGRTLLRQEFEEWRHEVERPDVRQQIGGAVIVEAAQ